MQLNQRKHSVQFADAAAVLDDENALTTSEHVDSEERFVTLETDSLGRILVVAYAWRLEKVRIISARNATPGERKRYAEGP